jgi:ribosomal subunit interface protein
MQTPLQLSGPDFHLTEAIKAEIQQRAAKFDRFCADIIGCRVGIEAPVHHHRKGGPFNVRIALVVPGKELAASHRNGESLSIAVREAFEAMERQLIQYSRERFQAPKHYPKMIRGQVTRLVREQGFGFIGTAEGREVYFNRASVMEPGFDKLAVGTEVSFSEVEGEQVPQTSKVQIAEQSGAKGA